MRSRSSATARPQALAAPNADFKTDPSLVTVYQIAETLGTTAEHVRNTLTPAELAEWAVFINSPFSQRGREVMMNGWLVHIIRSIVADKRRKPKFSDSVFPFEKVCRSFFAPEAQKSRGSISPSKDALRTTGEVAHKSQLWQRAYEKAELEYRAGKRPNRWGLFIGERLKG